MGMLRGRTHWYVFGVISSTNKDGEKVGGGKTVGIGPYRTESEARTAANNINDWAGGENEILAFKTSQLQCAKSCYRAMKSQQTGNLGITLQPIRSAGNKKTSRFEQIKESRGIE